jgi:sensor histidine kinase regulating citrate/malate metabolism
VAPLLEENRIVRLSLTDLGNDLILEVEDSGKGIPEDIAENIYEKDFSTSEKQGKGIGLYLVKDALRSIDGQLILDESSLGGALFTIYISKRPKPHAQTPVG